MAHPKKKPPGASSSAASNAQALFARGLGDMQLAFDVALGTAGPRALPAPPLQQVLDLSPEPATVVALERPLPPTAPSTIQDRGRPAELPLRAGQDATDTYRSGSRRAPYQRADGVSMIKQSFVATEAFDVLWRKIEGALPRTVSRNVWVEQVLSRAIREQLERGGEPDQAQPVVHRRRARSHSARSLQSRCST